MARSVEGKTAPILLGSGINQAGGTRGAAPGSLEYVINGRIQTSGRIEPRCGTTGITGTTQTMGVGVQRAVSASTAQPRPTERPAFLATRSDQKLCGTSAGDAFRHTSAGWVFQGSTAAAQPVRKRMPLAGQNPSTDFDGQLAATAALSTGEILVAGITTAGDLHFSIESSEGIRIYYAVRAVSAVLARAFAISDTFYLVYQVGTDLLLTRITVTSGQVGTVTNSGIVTTISGVSTTWMVCAGAGSNWYMTRQTAATTVTTSIWTGATQGTTIASTMTDPYLSLYYDSVNSLVWVGYVDDPASAVDVGFVAYNLTLTAATYAKTTITTTGTDDKTSPPLFGPAYTATAGSVFFIFSMQAASAGGVGVRRSRYGHVSSGTPSLNNSCYHIYPVSMPDAQQRVWCQFCPFDDEPPNVILLCRFPDAAAPLTPPVVVIESRVPGTLTLGSYAPHNITQFERAPHPVAITTESYGGSAFFAAPVAVQTMTNTSGVIISLVQHQVLQYQRYNQSPQLDTAQADDLVVAGQPTALWGNATNTLDVSATPGQSSAGAVEIGFAVPPAIVTATVGAGTLAVGTYLYQAVYQWPDARGNRHLSAPSEVVSVTVSALGSVALEITDFELGQRIGQTRPTVLIYRSVAGGTELHLVPAPQSAFDSSDGIISYTDQLSDATLATNEFIYTGGGVLANTLAPSCRYVVDAEDRLWCGGLYDRNIIQASKVRIPGEPYSFTDDASHQVVLPDECSGLAYMDGQVVAFTPSGIYLVGGDGPNDQGAGSFLPPRALIRGLGCEDEESASIVETELGIIFRSPSSWWLIPRGFGAPVDIGGVIQGETNTHCISAAITETPNYRLARFLVSTSGSNTSDTVLAFDLMNQQWFRDVYAGAAFSAIGRWPDGLVLFQNDLSSNAGVVRTVVWSEDEDNLTDAAASPVYIPLSLRTNWQYPFPFGPSGWGKLNRVQLAAEPLDAGGAVVRADSITITVETDQNSYAPTAWANTANADSGPLYREVVLTKPQCTCYRVTVQVVQSSGTATEGLRLLSIATELEPDGGIRMLPDAERSG